MASRQTGKSSAHCKKLLSFVQQNITKKQGKAFLKTSMMLFFFLKKMAAWPLETFACLLECIK